MDSCSIHYTYDALQDLEDIYDYISLELGSHGVAVAQIKRIRDEILYLLFQNGIKQLNGSLGQAKECGNFL